MTKERPFSRMTKPSKKRSSKHRGGRRREYDRNLPFLELLQETQTGLRSTRHGPLIRLMTEGVRLLDTSRRWVVKMDGDPGAEAELTAMKPAVLVTMLKDCYELMPILPGPSTVASAPAAACLLPSRVQMAIWRLETERWLAKAGWTLLEFIAENYEVQPAREKAFNQLAREVSQFVKIGSKRAPFDPRAYYFLSFLRDVYLQGGLEPKAHHEDADHIRQNYAHLDISPVWRLEFKCTAPAARDHIEQRLKRDYRRRFPYHSIQWSEAMESQKCGVELREVHDLCKQFEVILQPAKRGRPRRKPPNFPAVSSLKRAI